MMKTKPSQLLIGLCVLCALCGIPSLLGGCASDSMNAWLDRSNLQLSMQQQTMDGMYAAMFQAEAANQTADVAAAYRDIERAFVSKSTTQPSTQPADQAQWLEESRAFLTTRLQASRAKEATLRTRQAVSGAGFDDLRTNLQHIREINAAWYRTNADTNAALQNLATQIQQLRLEKAVNK